MNAPNLAPDNPTDTAADNSPKAEPDATTSGTGAPRGQASEAAPTDDLFKGVDPNRLPPEVKAHYDSMLRDYREKTAKLSETIKSESAKAAEAFKAKAEFYDEIATQEEFVKMWNEYVQKAQLPQADQQPGDPKLTQMEAKLQEMHQKMQIQEMAEVTDAFASAVDEKGTPLHPDFDELNMLSIGQVQTQNGPEDFSLLRACAQMAEGKTPQEKLANGYKAAKAAHDHIFEKGKKAGMGRLQAKMMNGSLPPSNAGGDVLSVTEKKPRTAKEALDLARRNIVVSRD
jgi:hypothetical protein